MLAALRHRWFLLLLVAILVLGFVLPGQLEPLADAVPRGAVVASVLFLMGLPLELGAMWRAVRRPGPAWLAALLNMGVAPPLAWLASRLLEGDLAIGLVVAAAVPTTLASAAVWTRRAGGNDAVAFLVTVVTNLACFAVAPGWLRLLIGAEVDIDFRQMAVRLAALVVLPLVVAQLVRLWRPAAWWASRHKLGLSVAAQLGILTMVFVGAVGCGVQLRSPAVDGTIGGWTWVLLIACVAGVHLAVLALGLLLARGLGMERPDQIAVAFAGSQKTLMVGLYIALNFGPLAILPMVAYHVVQLVLDTLVADRFRSASAKSVPSGRE